jgi:hypothetical protein
MMARMGKRAAAGQPRASLGAEEVVIPAARGLDGGIWFAVKEGVRGLVVTNEKGEKRVYVFCGAASNYYAVMTKEDLMPCLAGNTVDVEFVLPGEAE